MNTELRNALVTGPHTAKALAAIIGKSESRTRELLKAHAEEIQCRKEEGKNVFWVASDGNQETPINPDLANLQSEAEVTTVSDDPDTCPLCDSSANQVQAGPDGEFLGAAKTCSACNRTYNVHSREEITMPTPTAKGKRKPLNPQYKIDAKTAAVKDAGGKLTFDRESRQWVLHLKGKDPIRMTAKEFANETPESIVNRK